MKLVTIDAREVAGRPGVLLDSGQVLDLSAAPGSLESSQWIPQSTISILAAGERGLEHALGLVALADAGRDKLKQIGALTSLSGTPLMTPVRRPGLILISHKMGNGVPASFIKSPNTAVGHAVKVLMHGQPALVANPMFAAVLGKPLYQGSEDTAEAAICAWTLITDLAPDIPEPETADDWRNYVAVRQFPGSLPMGPALITKDELAEPGELIAHARINGVESWSGIICPPASECVARLTELSQHYAFSPGDVIAFATAMDSVSSPRQVLKPKDLYSIAVGSVMELGFELSA
ncbi:MAG: fumarylacetoacetate hydrolase family protein [Gammaproteobacteria bacterium]|nr:fumarylacetoacetate hydrolase family protein [Gammaproteobacteria bacterium]MCP4090542.1 fumarylacetoacetate hydrolase family protein [Gammaproteobacteria bacterium]MCP4928727.1 fumarylacetoacetate hydrolase family protein [Gammaproteobacteria bacterium]